MHTYIKEADAILRSVKHTYCTEVDVIYSCSSEQQLEVFDYLQSLALAQ